MLAKVLSASKVELGMAKDAQKTLMQIVDAVKKLPEEKRLGIIADLVGTEHSKTLALLVSNTEEWRRQITLANSEMATGSMSREFDTRMKALSSSWGLLKNSLFNINSMIGGLLAPTLKGLPHLHSLPLLLWAIYYCYFYRCLANLSQLGKSAGVFWWILGGLKIRSCAADRKI